MGIVPGDGDVDVDDGEPKLNSGRVSPPTDRPSSTAAGL